MMFDIIISDPLMTSVIELIAADRRSNFHLGWPGWHAVFRAAAQSCDASTADFLALPMRCAHGAVRRADDALVAPAADAARDDGP